MGHDINICALCDENTVIHNLVKFAKKKQLQRCLYITRKSKQLIISLDGIKRTD